MEQDTHHAKHTPTPWVLNGKIRNQLYIEAQQGGLICDMQFGEAEIHDQYRVLKDAEHIVRCVNTHDQLVKALQDMLMNRGDNDHVTPFIVNARKILALARLEG